MHVEASHAARPIPYGSVALQIRFPVGEDERYVQ